MQENQYITDRWLPEMVQRLCADKKIAVRTLSDDWVLVLEKDTTKRLIYGFKFSGLNDAATVAISQDKVGTYEILNDAQVAVVPHILISTRANHYDTWEKRAGKWGRFVVKPTHGGGGRAIFAFGDVAAAKTAMETHYEQSWCAAPFLPIVSEVRIILLDSDVLLAFKKQDPVVVHDMPMHNLRLGANALTIEPTVDLVEMAKAARRALGLRLAAVDIVTLENGEKLVLEVDEGFSLEHYMRQSIDKKHLGEQVYSQIIDAMFA